MTARLISWLQKARQEKKERGKCNEGEEKRKRWRKTTVEEETKVIMKKRMRRGKMKCKSKGNRGKEERRTCDVCKKIPTKERFSRNKGRYRGKEKKNLKP